MRKTAATWHEPGTHVERRPGPKLTPEQVLAQACPRCLARAAQPCMDGDGRILAQPHDARFGAARARAQRAGAPGRGAEEPVPIERVRAVQVPDPRRQGERAREAEELAARGLRLVPAHEAVRGGNGSPGRGPASSSPAAKARTSSVAPMAVRMFSCPRCHAASGTSCSAIDVRGREAFHEERTARARVAQANSAAASKAAKKKRKSKAAKAAAGEQLSQAERREANARLQAAAAERKLQARMNGMAKRERTQKSLSAGDRAYRDALGVTSGRLPGKLGATSSAGAARGGRGASRKGSGTYS